MEITSAEFVKGVMGTDAVLSDGVPQIAFVGRSNVGKSSVINSLVNQETLVKVGKKPGKTTELNIFTINKGKFYLVDLPGYGYAELSPKQREKIVKLINWYLTASDVRLFKVVLILDVVAGLTAFDEETIALLKEQMRPYLILVNKIDKLNQKELSERIKLIKEKAPEADIVQFSAKTGAGKHSVLAKIFTSD